MTPFEVLKKYGVQPNRRRGQNFLVDQNILKKIADSAGLTSRDTILEVGAGVGFLTRELMRRVKRVVAVEIDSKLVAILQEELQGAPNVALIADDVFSISVSDFLPRSYKLKAADYSIVANIPYNITSRFFRFFLERKDRPKKMTVLIQKEVADRICARQGNLSLLGLSVQLYGNPKILFTVSPSCFFPRPKVESAVLSIAVKQGKNLPSTDEQKAFFRTIKAGFSSPRKYCISNLSQGLGLEREHLQNIFKKIGLSEKIRAEAISLEQWLEISSQVSLSPSPPL